MGLYVGSTDICVPGGSTVGDDEDIEVYVGPTQVFPCSETTGLCLTLDNTYLCLPLGLAGVVDPTKVWGFSLEFQVDVTDFTGPYTGVPLFNSGPDGYPTDHYFGVFLADGIVTAGVNFVTTVGQSTLTNPDAANVGIRVGDWIRVTMGSDGIGPNVYVQWDNLTRGAETWTKKGYFPVAVAGFAPVAPQVCPGRSTEDQHFKEGSMRNAKLVYDGATLGDWPIQNYIQADGTVLDISGNENHGAVGSIGSGSIGACP